MLADVRMEGDENDATVDVYGKDDRGTVDDSRDLKERENIADVRKCETRWLSLRTLFSSGCGTCSVWQQTVVWNGCVGFRTLGRCVTDNTT